MTTISRTVYADAIWVSSLQNSEIRGYSHRPQETTLKSWISMFQHLAASFISSVTATPIRVTDRDAQSWYLPFVFAVALLWQCPVLPRTASLDASLAPPIWTTFHSSWVHGPDPTPYYMPEFLKRSTFKDHVHIDVSDLHFLWSHRENYPNKWAMQYRSEPEATAYRHSPRIQPTTLSSLPRTSLRDRALSCYNEISQGTINKISGNHFAIQQRRECKCIWLATGLRSEFSNRSWDVRGDWDPR